MKIVSLVWFKIFPPAFGGQKGIALFLKHLSAYFDITCICSRDNELQRNLSLNIIPLIPQGKWQFINPVTWFSILREMRREKAELLIIEHPYHAVVGFLAKKLLKIKVVLHEHNIEYLRFREMGDKLWPVLWMFEYWISKEADMLLFKTVEDRERAIQVFKLDPQKTIIVPYGMEMKTQCSGARYRILERYNLDPGCKIILFAGTLDYKPNAEAVEHIHSILAPILNKTDTNYAIIVCGRNKIKGFDYLNMLHTKNVIMAGEVTNIDEYYSGADIFINPVRTGGGMQTKTIDALSYNLPVVCFENMLAGIPTELRNTLVFPTSNGDWQKFADNILMLKEPIPYSQLAKYFKDNSWDVIAKHAAHNLKLLE